MITKRGSTNQAYHNVYHKASVLTVGFRVVAQYILYTTKHHEDDDNEVDLEEAEEEAFVTPNDLRRMCARILGSGGKDTDLMNPDEDTRISSLISSTYQMSLSFLRRTMRNPTAS